GTTSIDAASEEGDDADSALVDTDVSVDTGAGAPDAERAEASVLDATGDEAQDDATGVPAEAGGDEPVDQGDATDGSVGGEGGLPDASSPTAISFDFVGGGIPMGPTEVAGVFPASHWNSCADASGTLASLVDADGTASAAAVTWNGGGVWQLPVADAPGNA